jgi:hypothetical protein
MNKLLFFFALVSLSAVNFFAQTSAPESDFQIWNDTQIAIPFVQTKDKKTDKKTDRVSLILYATFRTGENSKRFIDERFGAGFEFRVNKYLTLTPNVIYRAGQPVPRGREYETRLRFDVGLEKKFKSFSIKDRNRIEQRFRNSRSDSTRYRNKFTFTVPVMSGKEELFAPFVAVEPFYEFQSKHWTRNETTFGISKKFNKALTAEFFYLLQNNRGRALRYVNVAGINLKFKIDRFIK